MELAIYNAFREAGVDEEKAQAIAANLNANFNTTINKAIEQNVDSKQLASKSDIEHHYAVHSQQTATKADIERVRAEIEKAKADIIKWIFGSIITAVGLATGIAMAIARLFFIA